MVTDELEYNSNGGSPMNRTGTLTADTARHWLDRWDRQQEVYIADREERFAVIADVVEAAVDRADPLIVDLGCGPGSLAVRLADRFPDAAVVGIDSDPLLLAMAQSAYGDRPGLRFVEGDLRTPGWHRRLDLDRAPDAVVSTTALHWMNRGQLSRLITELARLVRPGGVFVNGDHVEDGDLQPRLDRLTRAVHSARERRTHAGGNEDWQAWWSAVETAPELADLVRERAVNAVEHAKSDTPTVLEHIAVLRAAGFVEAGPVWQVGDDRVIVGIADR
jgi:SAM-dependent methyltransferase